MVILIVNPNPNPHAVWALTNSAMADLMVALNGAISASSLEAILSLIWLRVSESAPPPALRSTARTACRKKRITLRGSLKYIYIYIYIYIYTYIYIYILYVYNKHIFNIYITLLCIPIITQWLLDWILWLEILVVCVHNPPGYSTSFAMRDMGASNIYVMRSEVCGNFVCTYGWVGVGVCAYVSVRMDTPPTLL